MAVPTFRRPHFLPRLLACFKRIKYDNKKLVIINDDPECKYVMDDDPEIDIINIDKRLQLSVKRNLFSSWEFDIMFPLDDDDLFLPNRMLNHVVEYQENTDILLYRNRANLFIAQGEIRIGKKPASFTNSSFTREGYHKSGGYTAFHRSNHDDVKLRENFKSRCRCKIERKIETIDFVYQLGGGNYHNTFNDQVIMKPEMENKSKKLSLEGTINLNIDYAEYDNILNICNEVLESKIPTKIKLEENGSRIRRA